MKKHLIPLALLISLAACTEQNSDIDFTPDYPTTSEISLSRSETFAADALNNFGFEYFVKASAKLADCNSNIAVSPVSMSIALNILANTSNDIVAKSVTDAFDCEDLSTLNSLNKKLMQFLPDKTNKCDLALANSVWHSHNIIPTADYKERMSSCFFAEVNALDFSSDKAVDIINAWGAEKTHGMIQQMIEPDLISPVVFANALYFKGEWGVKFDEKATDDMIFRSPSGDVNVKMMHTEADLRHGKGSDYELVVIPYSGNNEMVIVVPSEGSSLNDLTGRLDYSTLSAMIENSPLTQSVRLSLPRFQSSIEREDFTPILSELGIIMTDVSLEFMTGRSNSNSNMGVFIQQSTKVITSEAGTEAAATTVGSFWTGNIHGVIQPTEMTVDRPFFYLIRNTVTGTIIIAGQYVQP